MTRLPGKLWIGDWTRQGLAFYSGAVQYVRRVAPRLRRNDRLFVELPDYRGVAARVLDAARGAIRLQTGYVYHYAFAMLIGVVALVSYFVIGGGMP